MFPGAKLKDLSRQRTRERSVRLSRRHWVPCRTMMVASSRHVRTCSLEESHLPIRTPPHGCLAEVSSMPMQLHLWYSSPSPQAIRKLLARPSQKLSRPCRAMEAAASTRPALRCSQMASQPMLQPAQPGRLARSTSDLSWAPVQSSPRGLRQPASTAPTHTPASINLPPPARSLSWLWWELLSQCKVGRGIQHKYPH